MYITSKYSGYNRDGEQSAAGRFLILASDDQNNLYACVRFVRLTQLGHFMMGTARIRGESLTVSGAYGSDGLPKDWNRLSENVRQAFVPVPADIAAAYWHPEHQGHNSSGSEAPILRKWALSSVA